MILSVLIFSTVPVMNEIFCCHHSFCWLLKYICNRYHRTNLRFSFLFLLFVILSQYWYHLLKEKNLIYIFVKHNDCFDSRGWYVHQIHLDSFTSLSPPFLICPLLLPDPLQIVKYLFSFVCPNIHFFSLSKKYLTSVFACKVKKCNI